VSNNLRSNVYGIVGDFGMWGLDENRKMDSDDIDEMVEVILEEVEKEIGRLVLKLYLLM